jgi:2-aminoadipate transaminase
MNTTSCCSSSGARAGATAVSERDLWVQARRSARLNPSIIREILKVTERPGVLSMAGGLPSPESFPVAAVRDACAKVLAETPREALQYAPSEGYGPLREWVAAQLQQQGVRASAAQVLITTGSQQGLDLAGKVLIDAGASVAVETPTYLGALQAFAPFEPEFVSLDSDADGPLPEAIDALPSRAPGTRFCYLLPNFQNPTGRVIPAARKHALCEATLRARVPIIEDNPYGELWFDAPPPAPFAALSGQSVLYLGSFSKILSPGLRLGYLLAPPALFPKLLQAKQAADLHTPGFNQRVAYEVIKDGLLEAHVPAIRARYKVCRDAMVEALRVHLPAGSTFRAPGGGMFCWVRLPEGFDTLALLDQAVQAGIAYVPGAAFYAHAPDARTLRLSFVTLTPAQIEQAVRTLGAVCSAAASLGQDGDRLAPAR